MAVLTITNLSSAEVLLQELYTTLEVGETLVTERFKDDLHSHPRIQALWDAGTISVSVAPDSSEDNFITQKLHALTPSSLSSSAPEDVDKSSAAVGVEGVAARGDHKHDIVTASAVELTDTTNSEGTSTELARANHQHAHGDRGGGSFHALATVSVAGFMSSADKTIVDDLPTNVADEDATSTFHEPIVIPEAGTNSPGQQPDLELIGQIMVAEFTVDTDTAYRIFKIPSNFVSDAEFHVHWTKESGIQGDSNELNNTVRWRLSYTVFQGEGTDINVSPTVVDLDDSYNDSGTTTRLTQRTADISAPGFVADYYIGVCVEAVTPPGSALTCEPALISVDLTYTQTINK